jgi:hypothetical protein
MYTCQGKPIIVCAQYLDRVDIMPHVFHFNVRQRCLQRCFPSLFAVVFPLLTVAAPLRPPPGILRRALGHRSTLYTLRSKTEKCPRQPYCARSTFGPLGAPVQGPCNRLSGRRLRAQRVLYRVRTRTSCTRSDAGFGLTDLLDSVSTFLHVAAPAHWEKMRFLPLYHSTLDRSWPPVPKSNSRFTFCNTS